MSRSHRRCRDPGALRFYHPHCEVLESINAPNDLGLLSLALPWRDLATPLLPERPPVASEI